MVYIEETGAGPRTIEGVSTRIAGFIGETQRGPSQPALVTSWIDFERLFGGYLDRRPFNRTNHIFLPYAVRGFFDNGGQRLFVARVVGGDRQRALAALMAVRDISIVAAPNEVVTAGLRNDIIGACEDQKDRFAITSADAGAAVAGLSPPRDTSYAAFYYPWIRVVAPHRPEGHRLIPPTGHLAGIYARVDLERGVHKPPANEVVRGIVTQNLISGEKPLEFTPGAHEMDALTQRGVNVIRDFRPSGRDIRVWGARTMSGDAVWKYVNVRRFFIFLEQSIARGLEWAVFESNVDKTWLAVQVAIENFLTTVWRDGALLGSKPEQAFFVKCDRTTMTQDDIDNGRLICEIGVAPVKPAEFVVFRFLQKTLEA